MDFFFGVIDYLCFFTYSQSFQDEKLNLNEFVRNSIVFHWKKKFIVDHHGYWSRLPRWSNIMQSEIKAYHFFLRKCISFRLKENQNIQRFFFFGRGHQIEWRNRNTTRSFLNPYTSAFMVLRE